MALLNLKSFDKKNLIFPLILLVAGCGNNGSRSKKANVPSYPVLQVSAKNVVIHDEYPATLEGEQVIEIRPKIEGYIDHIYVKEGAVVHKGQLLFHIQNQEYNDDVKTAEAAVNSAQADVNSAKLEVEKARPLVESNIISHYELDTDELTLKTKLAALEEAKAELATAKTNEGYLSIYSPHDGVIGTIPYKIGALVSSSSDDALTTLSSGSVMNAWFVLTEKELIELNKTAKGKSIQEKVADLPEAQLVLSDGSQFTENGKIELASGIVSTTTGSVSLKASFDNSDDLLQSGGSATIKLPHEYKDALLIPQSSCYEVLNKHLVVAVDSTNMAVVRAVNVTPTDDGKYYIVSSGLTAGDKIVLEGVTNIEDSTKIQPELKTWNEVAASIN